jgi:hypothetical protein
MEQWRASRRFGVARKFIDRPETKPGLARFNSVTNQRREHPMRIVIAAAAALGALSLAACGSPAEKAAEKQADQIEATGEAKADQLENAADAAPTEAKEDALDAKADATEKQADKAADAVEQKAEH